MDRACGPRFGPGGGASLSGSGPTERRGYASAPGHVTGIFVPEVEDPDPLRCGSRGAGIVLDVGVSASAHLTPRTAGSPPSVRLTERGQPARLPITQAAISALPGIGDWEVEVDLQHDLPISQGLGMSAAGSFASALAVASALGVPVRHAAEAAHVAEVRLHGGLGGVSSILGGGIEVRRKAGLPPVGLVERTPLSEGFFLATLPTPLPSPPLLSDADFLLRVSRAGERWLHELGPPPIRWEALLSVFELFTDELGLAPPLLRDTILKVRQLGARASQTMLGNTLLAWAPTEDAEEMLIQNLRRAKLVIRRVHIGAVGAGLRPAPPEA